MVLGPPYPPHPCPGQTGNGSWLTAPRDGCRERDSAGHRRPLTTVEGHPPQTGPPPPPRHAAPRRACKPRGQCWASMPAHPRPQQVDTLTARPEDGQPGEDERLTSDSPHKGARHPPGTPSQHPHSAQRRLRRALAVGPVLGPPYPHHRVKPCQGHTGNGSWLPAPRDGQPGEGQRLTPDVPQNGGRPSPPGTASHHPCGTQPPAGHASQRISAGPPGPNARARSTWVADPDSPP